jgi:acetoacetyl-CoA synthetase
MKVEIWREHGTNIDDSGESGELIIVKPFYSMLIGFWGVEGDEMYRKAYFADFPGVWVHGDLIRKNPSTGGYEILGRSNRVLNPGGESVISAILWIVMTSRTGVRFGTAELRCPPDSFNEIEDCIAVGQHSQNTADE